MLLEHIKAYKESLIENTNVITPKEIISELMEPVCLFRLKRELYTLVNEELSMTDDMELCLELLDTEDEFKSIFYTLVYIKLRNPIVQKQIDEVLTQIY